MQKMTSLMNALVVCLLLSSTLNAQDIVLKNDIIQRRLRFDGNVWRTIQFSNNAGSRTLAVKSDEVAILPMDAEQPYSIADFTAIRQPNKATRGDTSYITIDYKPRPETRVSAALPQLMSIKYYVVKGEPFSRKCISLFYDQSATVDRLEVERFIVNKQAIGGGRGEPVFVNNQWFFGLEYPAGYSRHTDGNTPKDYSRHYEKVGNYSYIDLEGKDIEPNAQKGMLRLMHFPGYAVPSAENKFQIVSKTAVTGIAVQDQSVQQAFMTYLSTIWKAPRSFLHFNNWFEPQAKDLKGDRLLNIWRSFKTAITPYGVKMDAMVVDDGWQNEKSLWQPSLQYFPNGFEDVKVLSQKLRDEDVGFGLWLSLNGYVNDINWGLGNGYKEAKPNKYFSQFGRYYSMSEAKYKKDMLKHLPFIAEKTDAVYFKHDFNLLSDISAGNNHPATDRHGHEANLDAAIEILSATRKMKPEIYQNLTNWIWFSPWWLMYSDYLWMLAGDDGANGNWPEISTRAMSTTDRDTYIWRMWGNPDDQPLVPISRLMTHGIIKTSDGRMQNKEDNLQDWLEYVLMHYGRGTLLKEWYISPSVMKPDEWKALCTVNNWAKKHEDILNNMVFVGGRPDEGNTYGYIGWNNDKGILVARNPQANPQKIVIPFNQTINFYDKLNEHYRANVVFPYQDVYPLTFTSGKDIEITLPGYSTLAMELEKGRPGSGVKQPDKLQFSTAKEASGKLYTTLKIPANVKGRCDLLLIGNPDTPAITINGQAMSVKRSSKSAINKFAGYAKTGMISDKAKPWTMTTFDLLPFAGKTIKIEYGNAQGFESYILAEQSVSAPKVKEANDLLWAITNDTRRQTIRLF